LVGSSSTSTLAGRVEQARQQQPIALAAGQRLHRGPRPLGREQEILQVAHHMTALAADGRRCRIAGPIVSTTVRSGSSCSRIWSK
jgi:hypothetical protein